jgi:hypothetical protein
MPIYTFEPQNHQLAALNSTKFHTQGILEKHLQTALKHNIAAISPDTLIIAEEFSEWDDCKRRIDLLGIDRSGNIVIIELKRDEQGAHMELQALRYAAMVSTVTFDRVVDIYQKYLGESYHAKSELEKFLGWGDEEGKEAEFPNDVRIVLAAADFDREITTTVMWLNQRDLDIRCVRMKPYQLGENILVDVEQIIPLPESQDYQVKLRQQSAVRRSAKIENELKSKVQYRFNGRTYGSGKLVLAVIKQICMDYPSFEIAKLRGIFPKKILGGFEIAIEQSEGEKIWQETGYKRHFLSPEDVIQTVDGKSLAVCKEWTKDKTRDFIQHVPQEFGYTIESIALGQELNYSDSGLNEVN